MAWIEAHDTLPDHPKVLRAAKALRLDSDALVGKLLRLWTWALSNREDGVLSDLDAGVLHRIMNYGGKADKLLAALTEVRLLDALPDGRYAIHDWDEHVGLYRERKEAQREFARRKNALYGDMRLIKRVRERDGDTCQYCGKTVNWKDRRGPDGGTYNRIDPEGETVLENLCVCCRACGVAKGNRTPEEAGMRLLSEAGPAASGRSPADSPAGFLADSRQVFLENQTEKSSLFSSLKPAFTVPNQNHIDDPIDDPAVSPARVRAREAACGKTVDNLLQAEIRETIREGFRRRVGREPQEAELSGLCNLCGHGGMPTNMALLAVEQALTYGATSVAGYACKTLISWQNRSLLTPEAVRAWEAERAGETAAAP